MYKVETKSWVKHLDFMLLDILCLEVSVWAAFCLQMGRLNFYNSKEYRNLATVLLLVDIVVVLFANTFKNILKRDYHTCIKEWIKQVVLLSGGTLVCLFIQNSLKQYPREMLYCTIGIYAVLTLAVRVAWKVLFKRKIQISGMNSLVLLTTSAKLDEVLEKISQYNYQRFRIAGIALYDCDMVGQTFQRIPVVANAQTVASYVCKNWVDQVLIVDEENVPCPTELVKQLMSTGVTVHQNLHQVASMYGGSQVVERIGSYLVLTTSIKQVNTWQMAIKRFVDILGGLAGCVITAIVFVFVAPAIYINSPGPIFFSQKRVGKNGKIFKMYKFRSMYLDAEQRKAELMKNNRVSDGKMFKLDFDPRVIGNKILPDGTKKTGIGNFIRVTSLDEFPQFFNVLKGDMSIVGTRPPLLDEVSEYDLHHRTRLAIKPGITGMWQVSGRSEITDFEEVVRLDTEYISNWSVWLDVKILFKTVMVVLKKDGSM